MYKIPGGNTLPLTVRQNWGPGGPYGVRRPGEYGFVWIIPIAAAAAGAVVYDYLDDSEEDALRMQKEAADNQMTAEINASRAQAAEGAELELRRASNAKDDYQRSQLGRSEEKWRQQRQVTVFTDETRRQLGLGTEDIDRRYNQQQALILDELIGIGNAAQGEQNKRECEEVQGGLWREEEQTCDVGGLPWTKIIGLGAFAIVGTALYRKYRGE